MEKLPYPFNDKIAIKWMLIFLVSASFLFRIWNLGAQDMATDDVLYSLRSIGYVDYVATNNTQTTPVFWFDERQWWQGLSFHDHPPLVFMVQWLFFKIGGVNAWAARLPFAIAGALSVFFMFLLGKKMFNPAAGLFAAAALAISNYAIWISRVGYLDGFLVLWLVLSLYFFSKAKTEPVNYLWWAVFCAAGVMTKYTFGFIMPVFLLFLVLKERRQAFKNKWLYAGIGAFLALVSPVIIYNIMTFLSRGHFDAALSSMLGIQSPDFGFLKRQAGSNFHIFSVIKDTFWINFSAGFQLLLLSGIFLFFFKLYKDKINRESFGIILSGLFLALLSLGVMGGGGGRFGVIVLPFSSLFIGYAGYWLFSYFENGWKQKVLAAAVVIFAAWELFYAVQSQLVIKPFLNSRLFISENLPLYDGYRELNDYVDNFYKINKGRPAINSYKEVPQLYNYQKEIINKITKDNYALPPYSRLLVYDDHLSWFPAVWIFERRNLYEAKTAISMYGFLKLLYENGVDFYRKFGLKDITVIIPTKDAQRNEYVNNEKELNNFINELEKNLRPETEIRGHDGKVLFKIYTLPLI